jgi:peptidoglycan/LPS O-acetylase OafA/YrhL
MLSFYLLLSIIFLLVVIFFNRSLDQGKKILLAAFAMFLVASVWVLARYIHSSDKEFYKNVETHAIEHLGYDFANSHELNLINAKEPTTALLDEEQGKFSIKVDTLQTKK